MEAFSGKWFAFYYAVLGVLALMAGIYILLRSERFRSYLERHAEYGKIPIAIRNILKYFLLFTIPGLILSFIPFSWIELLFSLWSLLVVYTIGIQLVRWDKISKLLLSQSFNLKKYLRFTGAIMVAVSLVMFILCYLVINRSDVL